MATINPRTFIRSLLPEPGVQRAYVTSSFVSTVGGGIIMPISILYFTRIVGVDAAQVGLAFMIAGLLAIPFSVPAGELADRIGPRRVAMGGLAGLCVAGMGFLLVRDFWTLLLAESVITFSFAAYMPSVGALLRRVGGEHTVRLRSQVRASANAGVALGSLASGIGIEIGTPTSYKVLLILFCLAQLSASLLLLRVPNFPPLPRPETDAQDVRVPRRIALRDLPFVAYATVGGAMMLQSMILEILIPVWIVDHTHAPAWAITLAFVINTTVVVLLQVRLGDKVHTVKDGGAALREHDLPLRGVRRAGLGAGRGVPPGGARPGSAGDTRRISPAEWWRPAHSCCALGASRSSRPVRLRGGRTLRGCRPGGRSRGPSPSALPVVLAPCPRGAGRRW